MEANLNVVEYRVVLIDPGSRKVLGHTDGSVFRLLRVCIPSGARAARQLRAELLRKWGIGAVILEFLSANEGSRPCVVVELLKTDTRIQFSAASVDDISDADLSEPERTNVQRVLRDEVTPFSRIGWMDEAIAWVESETGRRLCPKDGIEQHNAGGAFTLLHLWMEDGSEYWLKATGAPNSHERQITGLLSRLCPPCLPRIVAEKPEWNAWLMTGGASALTSLPSSPDDLVQLLGQAVHSLAELQINTVGKECLLFGAGAFDQRLDVIRRNADRLFAYVEEAMSLQTSTKAPQIGPGRLKELRDILQRACDHAERMGIPPTILHGDMNLGNLVFIEDSCQFIDWSEGYVGHPLVTLQHLLLLNPLENLAVKARVDDAVKGIYRATMSALCDPLVLSDGFECMAFLAAASVLYGRGNWNEGDLRRDSPPLGYVRSVARHMDRSARDPAFREALRC
jgi:Phosphotransferase enzyme family